MDAADTPLTLLLDRAAQGDAAAAREVLPLVYRDLRELAGARMRRLPAGQTLQPTALVHEAYLRVQGRHEGAWEGRAHFFFAAARAMHDILVEQARRKAALKHGGALRREDAEDLDAFAFDTPADDVLALHAALEKLEQVDLEGHRIVELRYFVGLSVDEVAAVMGLSVRTVERRWRFLRAWLDRELSA